MGKLTEHNNFRSYKRNHVIICFICKYSNEEIYQYFKTIISKYFDYLKCTIYNNDYHIKHKTYVIKKYNLLASAFNNSKKNLFFRLLSKYNIYDHFGHLDCDIKKKIIDDHAVSILANFKKFGNLNKKCTYDIIKYMTKTKHVLLDDVICCCMIKENIKNKVFMIIFIFTDDLYKKYYDFNYYIICKNLINKKIVSDAKKIKFIKMKEHEYTIIMNINYPLILNVI